MYEVNNLLDSYSKVGNDIEELKTIIKEMHEHTEFVHCNSTDISLLSFAEKGELHVAADSANDVDREEDVTIPCVKSYLLLAGNANARTDTPIDTLLKAYRQCNVETPELLNEWTERTKLAFAISDGTKKSLYLSSSSSLSTMERFGLAGSFMAEPSLERDMMIAKQLERNTPVTCIVKRCGNMRKLFSILSDKYTDVKQDVLFDIVKEISEKGEVGEETCHEWYIDNFFTKLYVEFPEKAEELSMLYGLKKTMIPGLLLMTSDTGHCSLKILGTWRVDGSRSTLINAEVKHRHIGKIDIDKIIDDVSNQIFAEYAKLPDALCALMEENITDTSLDLSNAKDIEVNRKCLQNVIKNAFKTLGMTKAVGKKQEIALRNSLCDELDATIAYTAYDIAMMIFSIPDRVEGCIKRDLLPLQRTCGNAPFIKYSTDAADNDEAMFLA